ADIVNTASVTAETADPDPANNQTTAALPVDRLDSPVADVALEKEFVVPDGETVTPGETVEMRFTLSNTGPSTAYDIRVVDTLPAQLAFVGSAQCTGTTGLYGSALSCAPVPSLEIGATAVLTVVVRVHPAYTGDGSDIVNQAQAEPGSVDPNPINNMATADLGGQVGAPVADLSLVKSTEAQLVSPGDTFEYILTVRNAGPSTATDVQLVDTLPAELEYVTNDRRCVFEEPALTCDLGSIDPGRLSIVALTVRLAADYVGDGSDVVNTATVTSPVTDPDLGNNTDEATVPAGQPLADLAITKAPASEEPVVPGETFDYLLTVTNAGPAAAAGVVVTDTLPAELAFVSSEQCTGTAGEGGGTVTCGPLAGLAVGAGVTYTLTVRLDPGYLGDGSDVVNTATVDADTEDLDRSDNTATAGLPGGTVAAASADVSLTKEFPLDGPVAPGQEVPMVLTVSNAGPSDAQGVTVTDPLPAQLAFLASEDCEAPAGQYGATLTCTVGTVGAAASVTLSVTVLLDPGYTGTGEDVVNVATAAAATPDPVPGNNEATATLTGAVGEPVADLAIVKTGSDTLEAGAETAYTLTVTNAGPSVAARVVVTDELPPLLSYVTAGPGCGAEGQTVTCDVGAVAPGQSVELTLTALVSPDAAPGEQIENVALVAAATADPEPGDNTGSAVGTVAEPGTQPPGETPPAETPEPPGEGGPVPPGAGPVPPGAGAPPAGSGWPGWPWPGLPVTGAAVGWILLAALALTLSGVAVRRAGARRKDSA
ncbi:hypothetical protein DNL40_10100, partial [Xylanimonas oleitrophica]